MRTHLSRFHHNPISFHCFFQKKKKKTEICLLILQTLFSHATLFVRVPDGSFLVSGRFDFSFSFDEFMNNAIDVRNEDVLYNWMDRAFKYLSKAGNPLRLPRKCILLWFRL